MNIRPQYIQLVTKYGGNPKEFFAALEAMAKRLGIAPEWIADVIYIESGFYPAAKNPGSSASGLIQFMESTAKDLGTTTAQLRTMKNVHQLPYVEKYLSGIIKKVGKPKDFFETYCLVFQPRWVGKPDSSTLEDKYYRPNRSIDLNKNGAITKGEFRTWANKQLPGGVALEEIKKKAL